MLKELLEKYHPQTRGFINVEEVKLIKETLHIAEMDVLALRNLRDFTVMFLSREAKENESAENIMENWDKMSAITHIIDVEIMKKVEEV
jgi:hypothetical protein